MMHTNITTSKRLSVSYHC